MLRLKKFWKKQSTNGRINIIGVVLTAVSVVFAILSFALSDLRLGDLIFPNPTLESSLLKPPSPIPSLTIHPTPTLAPTQTPLPIATRGPDESLILLSTFFRTENVIDTAIHDEINHAIKSQIATLKLQNVRVELEPEVIRSDDRNQAQILADQYDATQIIWGQDTGVRIVVNFLNREQPDYEAGDVTINETERTQIADPASYNEFVVEDLPGQLAFLSLFALAQAYYADEFSPNLPEAARVLERAMEALPGDEDVNVKDQRVAAYFRLGWLYQKMGDLIKAKGFYLDTLDLYPEFSAAHNNLGLIFFQEGDYKQALFEYDLAIQLNPNNARAYNNRAILRYRMGDTSGAISDYDVSIDIRPTPRTYLNRGLVYQFLGDFEPALNDYNKAIDIDPSYALAYFRRGRALYRDDGDCTSAIADYQKYLELRPDSYDRKIVESEIATLSDRKSNNQCK